MKSASIAVLLGIALWAGSGGGFAADKSQIAKEVRNTEPVRDGPSRVDKAIDATELSSSSKINPDTPAHVYERAGDTEYSADVKRCGTINGTDKVLCIVPANRSRDQM
jgi:hypothetical protein